MANIHKAIMQALSSRWIAKVRLKEIIAADRASVPCGRWVKVGYSLRKSGPPYFDLFDVWPRYRYQERR